MQELIACDSPSKRSELVQVVLEIAMNGNRAESVGTGVVIKRKRAADANLLSKMRLELTMVVPRGKHVVSFNEGSFTLSPWTRPDEITAEIEYGAVSFLAKLPTIGGSNSPPSTIVIALKDSVKVGRSTTRYIIASYNDDDEVTDTLSNKKLDSLYDAISDILTAAGVTDRFMVSG